MSRFPTRFEVRLYAPFDSLLHVDHSMLGQDEERFRRRLAERLAERFGERLELNPSGRHLTETVGPADPAAFEAWLNQRRTRGSNRFDELRPTSLFRVRLPETPRVELVRPVGSLEHLVLDELVVSLHEHGVAVLSGRLAVDFATPPLPDQLRDLLGQLEDEVLPECESLLGLLRDLDEALVATCEACLHDLPAPSFADAPGGRGERTRADPGGSPMERLNWCHLVSVVAGPSSSVGGADDAPPFAEHLPSLLQVQRLEDVSHACPAVGGFVYLGWGHSLLVDLDDHSLHQALAVVRTLEAEWRRWDRINRIILDRLEGLVGQLDRLQKARLVRWVERAIQEVALCEARRDELTLNQLPDVHALTVALRQAWRMDAQVQATRSKLASLEDLYRRAADRQSGLLLATIAGVTLTSAAVAAAETLWPTFATNWSLGARLLLVSVGPLVALLWIGLHHPAFQQLLGPPDGPSE